MGVVFCDGFGGEEDEVQLLELAFTRDHEVDSLLFGVLLAIFFFRLAGYGFIMLVSWVGYLH